ncbi:MAG TPA: hypothetical protein DCM50_02655 [Stenotrophomonas sp.]|nr:hypothetical protein [Stenotrophomonas sp.]
MSGELAWVRKNYGAPAQRGMRVEYTGDGKVEAGTIRSASGGRRNIQLDTAKHTCQFHPTWELRYLTPAPLATVKPPRDLRTTVRPVAEMPEVL